LISLFFKKIYYFYYTASALFKLPFLQVSLFEMNIYFSHDVVCNHIITVLILSEIKSCNYSTLFLLGLLRKKRKHIVCDNTTD